MIAVATGRGRRRGKTGRRTVIVTGGIKVESLIACCPTDVAASRRRKLQLWRLSIGKLHIHQRRRSCRLHVRGLWRGIWRRHLPIVIIQHGSRMNQGYFCRQWINVIKRYSNNLYHACYIHRRKMMTMMAMIPYNVVVATFVIQIVSVWSEALPARAVHTVRISD